MKNIVAILFLFGTAFFYGQYDPNYELRINCGDASSTVSYNGDDYDPDIHYLGGDTYSGTPGGLPSLYTTERWDGDRFLEYEINVDNGHYLVILHFAEIFFDSVGSRIFDINLEEQLMEDNFDMYSENGANPIVKTYELEIVDGQINIDLSSLLADGGTGNPKISAIEVLGASFFDNQIPTAPTLTGVSNTDTMVDLSWSGATDNTGVTNFRVYKDGIEDATLGNVFSYQATGLTASTAYNFTVTALDAVGNESSASNVVSLTTDASSGGGGSTGSVWTESSGDISYLSGNVAIGTSTVPTGYKLAVDGHIRTREIRVDQDTWPDYVFNEDYELLSLEKIKAYIDEHGHLPNIPSASEVEQNGVEVGKMNRLLLEKIEELTLYLFYQDDAIKNQQKVNQDLMERIQNLEESIKTTKRKNQ